MRNSPPQNRRSKRIKKAIEAREKRINALKEIGVTSVKEKSPVERSSDMENSLDEKAQPPVCYKDEDDPDLFATDQAPGSESTSTFIIRDPPNRSSAQHTGAHQPQAQVLDHAEAEVLIAYAKQPGVIDQAEPLEAIDRAEQEEVIDQAEQQEAIPIPRAPDESMLPPKKRARRDA